MIGSGRAATNGAMISNSFQSVNRISPATKDALVKTVQQKAPAQGGYVAFDADGTLWHHDASELFFDELIGKNLVPLPENPKEHYQNLKKQDPRVAYTWLAQILKGLTVEQVRAWAGQTFRQHPLEVFADIFDLLERFRDRGLEIWVVTASVQWVVEAGAALYGLPVTGVLGVRTEVDPQGLITDAPATPVTWREGKAEALLQKKAGVRPLFSAGNTLGDAAMMEISETPPLALHSHQAGGRLQVEERQLQELAKKKGWLTHSF